jgi:alpha-methylacyl-CoA racemase
VTRTGPLTGVRVIEMAGLGPGPYCAMVLADLGADVVRIDRDAPVDEKHVGTDVLNRGRRSLAVDLKHPRGPALLLDLVERADVLVEGFRPGVMERLGLGPEPCHARNPRLVYGRMTGWGQDGPLAARAGHDVNYVALTGALFGSGRADGPPQFPMNLLGDFGGGGNLLALGVVAALFERERSGQGQVIDAAIVDGTASLATFVYAWIAGGRWDGSRRGVNWLDTGAPWYDVYETSDGGHMTVGAIEPQFYAELVRLLDLSDLPGQHDVERWPELRSRFAERFAERTRDEWAQHFGGSDACVAPVLSFLEAPHHPHVAARGTFVEEWGIAQPAPAPRFSRTPGALSTPPPLPGQHSRAVLHDWGLVDDELFTSGAVVQRDA